MNTKDKDQNAAAWWLAITVVTAQVAIVVIGLAAAQALGAFAGTAEAWRGLAETIRAVPPLWSLAPAVTLLAVSAGFCAVRWVQAHARVVEAKAVPRETLPLPPENGREPMTLAERHASTRVGKRDSVG